MAATSVALKGVPAWCPTPARSGRPCQKVRSTAATGELAQLAHQGSASCRPCGQCAVGSAPSASSPRLMTARAARLVLCQAGARLQQVRAASRPAARARQPRWPRPPHSRADHATRILLQHSALWDTLTAEDHCLLCAPPAPHGGLLTWLEAQLHEHGPLPGSTT